MPELPEVETVRVGLQSLIVGKTVTRVDSNWTKSFSVDTPEVDSFVIGSKISAISRRAKVILIVLDTGYTLLIHLKMTGQLVFVPSAQKSQNSNIEGRKEERFGAGHPNDSLRGKLPDRSTRVTFVFNDKSKLYFNDQRKFGWIKLVLTADLENHEFLSKLGPEPLSAEFTFDVFNSRLQKRKGSAIKAALLDQTVLAGVGNIYADESLWAAKIHPSEIVKNISKSRLKKLHTEIIFVLKLSIEKGGSTDKNYVNAEGRKGSYLEFAKVFRREKLPCPNCGTMIEKIRIAGRGTHVCPKCQKSITRK